MSPSLPYILILMGLIIIILLILIGLNYRRIRETDARIDQIENRIREVLTRIDTIDQNLGDLDIKSAKSIESNKTRLAEFKKEQNNRCDKLAKRLEVLEDAAGNIESVGNLAEEVRSYGRRMKEVNALLSQSTMSLEAVNKLAMSNQQHIQSLQSQVNAIAAGNLQQYQMDRITVEM